MRQFRSVGRIAAAVLGGLGLAGCGGTAKGSSPTAQSQTLTVYSGLPLQGPDQARQASIVNGEKLALYQAGGHVGKFHISFASLDDSDPKTGAWTPEQTLIAARTASQDTSTIAYIGDWDSGASAISLPLLNETGVLQVSPASTYVGLTEDGPTDGRGEPDRYYPAGGPRTFAHLAPTDVVEARAMVQYMKALGVHRVYLLGDYDVFDADIAAIIAREAPAAGIAVAGQSQIDMAALGTQPVDYAKAAQLATAGGDAVLFGGVPGPAAEALWQALHAAAPRVKLFAASSLATPGFVAVAGPAAPQTYVTSPVLELNRYPPAAQQVLRQYQAAFHTPGTAYSLYGYEAMSAILAAIRLAGPLGSDRATVVREFFSLRDRDSVLGRYSITPTGETTLSNMAGYTVGLDGRLRFARDLTGG
ncbi:MAG: branched-chain amino acid transport system substrate-binding protein [Solirubrobacteraceae bacterium]|nr:branched-chain amino acid transport system substrate-binding protein [Solirubrobacteraceae bacterium]